MMEIRKWRNYLRKKCEEISGKKMGQGRDKRYVYVVLVTKIHILYI